MKRTITADDVKQFARVSGDAAPIHVSVEAAEAAGFTQPIAHGLYIMALCEGYVQQQYPGQVFHACQGQFLAPLQVPNEIDIVLTPEANAVEVSVTCHMQPIFQGIFKEQ